MESDLHGGPKIGTILYALILPNINRFSKKIFHCQNQEKICNNTTTKDPTTTQVWIATLPCEMSQRFIDRAIGQWRRQLEQIY